MRLPQILTRVEQGHRMFSLRIDRASFVRLSAIAMEAGKRKILDRVGSTLSNGENVVNGELNVLPLLRCVTVFAQKLSALPDLLLKFKGEFATGGHLS